MRIQQVHISHHVWFFTKQFCQLWNLREYDNVNDPALFFGCYDHREIEIIKAHRGFKLVMPTGEGSTLAFAEEDKVQAVVSPALVIADKPAYVNSRQLVIPVKDYSTFTPVPLGNKIYCYQGHDNESCKRKYNYGLLRELMQELGEERFLIGYHGHTPGQMIEEFYHPSFINLQLNPQAGFSSTLEMAHMGRPSICNIQAGFCLNYKSGYDILMHINTIDKLNVRIERVAYWATTFLHHRDDFLHTEYWEQ